MCCLEYENPYYSEVYPKMPKLNSEVKTPDGVGTVMYTNALKQIASVKITTNDGGFTIKDFNFDEISKIANQNNNQQQPKKEENPQIKVNIKPLSNEDEKTTKEDLKKDNNKNKKFKKNKQSK